MANNFGQKFENVLANILKVTTEVAAIAAPVIDTVFPGIAGLYNMSVTAALEAEQAAQTASAGAATQADKLAAIVAAVTPYLMQAAAQAGLTPPTQAQILAYAESVLAGLEALSPTA